MTTKKGTGGSGRPPPVGRPQAPLPPPQQPKRPAVRPIGGAKPPAIRPLTTQAKPVPAPPPKTEPLPSLRTSDPALDEDATNVMDRSVFARAKPKVDPPRVVPAPARPARPAIDVVPKNQRVPTERTAVMPNAPVRSPGRAASHAPPAYPSFPPPPQPSFPPPNTKTARGAQALPGSVPPPAATARVIGTGTDPLAPPAVQTSTSLMPPQQPPTARGYQGLAARPDTRPPPPVQNVPDLSGDQLDTQDQTLAMHRGNWTPSAPPIAFGPMAYPPLQGTPPPANVRRPPSVAPGPMLGSHAPPAHFSVPPRPDVIAPSRGSGVLGLVLYAAPLAFATLIIAALALL